MIFLKYISFTVYRKIKWKNSEGQWKAFKLALIDLGPQKQNPLEDGVCFPPWVYSTNRFLPVSLGYYWTAKCIPIWSLYGLFKDKRYSNPTV